MSIALGPFTLPAWLLAAGLAYTVARLGLRRFVTSGEQRAAIDTVTMNSVMLFAAGWKLAPLVTETHFLFTDPVVLLRAPGGPLGVVLGVVLAAGYLIARRRTVAQVARPSAGLVIAFAALFGLSIALADSLADRTLPQDTQPLVFELLGDSGTGEVTFSDETVVLNFWATWCGPCRGEIPAKAAFYEDLPEGVRFIAVNLTNTESGSDVVADYRDRYRIAYPIALDRSGRLAARYGVRGTPTTVVIASDGSVVTRWVGAASAARFARAVRAATNRRVE